MRTSFTIGRLRTASLMMLSGILLSLSCTKTDSLGRISDTDDIRNLPIRWDVHITEEFLTVPTKALIEDYTSFRNACTTTEEHDAEKIGVFGTYTIDENRTSIFEDIDLWWWEKEDGNPFNDITGNPSGWNYEGEDVYWIEDAEYSFKAYFPKSKVSLEPGSGSDRLLAVYDSQTSQYDLMVAGKVLNSKEENPVNLIFKHSLAALKFNFKFKSDGVTDYLTSCWLENVNANGFYSSCTLNYEDAIKWPQSTPDPIGSRMYFWEPSTPLLISSETATAYSTKAASDKGNIYTENEGWLLVIPQICPGPETLQLCFKTNTGGDAIYRVGLPATELLPGKRYTYNINISSTQIELQLGIADWNKRDSSHEIDFNN